ncbi:MAG: hypothetical protein R8K47_05790 [Mariprofundaceae bacterium]
MKEPAVCAADAATLPVGRFGFGLALLTLAITADGSRWTEAFLPALLAAALLAWLDWRRQARVMTSLGRAWRMLRWLVWPILGLHAWLTPGARLWPEIAWSPTREGLLEGLHLSIHLAALFLSAMLLVRLPGAGFWQGRWMRRHAPVLWQAGSLVGILHRDMRGRVSGLGTQFRLRKRWRDGARMLLSAVTQGWREAEAAASALWLRWPVTRPEAPRMGFEWREAAWASSGVLLLLVGWSIG